MFFVGRRFEEKLFQMIFESADSWENRMEWNRKTDIGCSCDQVCVWERERMREWERCRWCFAWARSLTTSLRSCQRRKLKLIVAIKCERGIETRRPLVTVSLRPWQLLFSLKGQGIRGMASPVTTKNLFSVTMWRWMQPNYHKFKWPVIHCCHVKSVGKLHLDDDATKNNLSWSETIFCCHPWRRFCDQETIFVVTDFPWPFFCFVLASSKLILGAIRSKDRFEARSLSSFFCTATLFFLISTLVRPHTRNVFCFGLKFLIVVLSHFVFSPFPDGTAGKNRPTLGSLGRIGRPGQSANSWRHYEQRQCAKKVELKSHQQRRRYWHASRRRRR